MTTNKSLSQRTFESLMRMHQIDNRIARPKLEDFAHLDVEPATTSEPAPPAAQPTDIGDRVAASLARMQDASRVRFAGGDAA